MTEWDVILIETDGYGIHTVETLTQAAHTAVGAAEQAALSLGWTWMPQLEERDDGAWAGAAHGVSVVVRALSTETAQESDDAPDS